MSGAAIGAGASAIGGAINLSSDFERMDEQAQAAQENASFFYEQADQIQASIDREMDIFERELDHTVAGQAAAFAKGGVDFSGSVLNVFNEEIRLGSLERSAIKIEGALRVKEANLKAMDSTRQAMSLTNPGTRMKMLLGTVLSVGGSVGSAVANTKSSSRTKATGGKTASSSSKSSRATGAGHQRLQEL
jgi:hypothetical protein